MLTSAKALTLMGIIYITSTTMLGSHLFLGVALVAFTGIIFRILNAVNLMQPLSHSDIRIATIIGIGLLIFQATFPLKLADGFINLLLLGTALKFLEYNSNRDSYILVCALLFLSIVPLIFHYNVYIAFYITLIPILIIWTLIAITNKNTIAHDFKLISFLTLSATPLTVALFMVFPRTGAIWIIPSEQTPVVGLSEEMKAPGLINLTQSDRTVARIIFEGEIPKLRYFQGVIYEKYDGNSWTQSRNALRDIQRIPILKYNTEKHNPKYHSDKTLKYSIILEPTGTSIIPTLKYSSTAEDSSIHISGDTYRSSQLLSSRKMFHFTYHPDIQPQQEELFRQRFYLYLPPKQNPKTLQLVNSLIQDLNKDSEKADAIYTYFSNNFKYTLSTNISEHNSTDDLLFNTRAGFCAHYAEAMAIMLRMANIPSRVVGGYLGGKIIDNYVILHDYDAHAWVEAYINKRWVAFDPTSLVAPARIYNSLSTTAQSFGEHKRFTKPNNFNQKLLDFKEYIDFNWNFWVLNFNTQDQISLFKNNFITMLGVVLIGLVLTSVTIIISILRRPKKKLSLEQKLLNKALKIIENKGFTLKPGEDIIVFKERLTNTSIGSVCVNLFDIYISLRYKNITQIERKTLENDLKNSLKKLKKI